MTTQYFVITAGDKEYRIVEQVDTLDEANEWLDDLKRRGHSDSFVVPCRINRNPEGGR